ncbi:glycosyltransferase family 4 protein [Serratia marcescens]|nr:glycosyltransferase family 4 protein [Serratia marcescens]
MIYINARFLTQGLTGVQRFAEQISLELKKIRSDIVFVSPNNIVRNNVADELNAIRIGKKSGHYWEQIELPNYLRKNGCDLLVNLGNTGPVFYKKQIVTHHDVTYKKFPQSYSRKFRAIYNFLIPLLLRNSLALVTVSEFSKKEISNAYHYDSKNISVIYNAASAIFENNAHVHPQFSPFFLAVSSPNFHKNFHGLVEAFSELKGVDEFTLKIIGEKNRNFSSASFDESLEKAGGRIEFLGRVSDDELADLYSAAYAFIFPSFYEGFGIPPLEAQACGCPVLSSHAASMPEVLADSALYFNPYDKNEIKDAVIQIANNPDKRSELIAKGYKNIHRFSWSNSARELSVLIDRLIESDKKL